MPCKRNNSTSECEYRDANHHSITHQHNTTVIVNRVRRIPSLETTAVVDERRLRIGFYYWLFKKHVQPTGVMAARPPSKSQILAPLTELCAASATPWRRIIAEATESKVSRSLSIVVRLLWHCPLPEEGASARGFNYDATVNVITEYSSDYIIKLLRHRLQLIGAGDPKFINEILNTHVPRVMLLAGRGVAETVADREARKEIGGPMNTVCTNYSIDNPVLRSEYVNLAETHKVETRNSVVPPLACLVNKAMLCVNVVETYIGKSLSALSADDAAGVCDGVRTLQNVKNNLLWYLEQVLVLNRVSRTGEAQDLRFSDITLVMRTSDPMPGKRNASNEAYERVPAIICAFVPELLEHCNVYLENTHKGKTKNMYMLHLHDVLPECATLLSILHAACFVVRVMFMYDREYLDRRVNEDMCFFVKRNKDGSKLNRFKSADSKAPSYSKNLQTCIPNNTFSGYSARYLVAQTLVYLNFIRVRNGGKEHLTMLEGLSQEDARKGDAYIRELQFGHHQRSFTLERVYSTNPFTITYRDTRSNTEHSVKPVSLRDRDLEKVSLMKQMQAKIRRAEWQAMHHGSCGARPRNIAVTVPHELARKVEVVRTLLSEVVPMDGQRVSADVEAIDRSLDALHSMVQDKKLHPALLPNIDLTKTFIDTDILPEEWATKLQMLAADICNFRVNHKSVETIASEEQPWNNPRNISVSAEGANLNLSNILRLVFYARDATVEKFSGNVPSNAEKEPTEAATGAAGLSQTPKRRNVAGVVKKTSKRRNGAGEPSASSEIVANEVATDSHVEADDSELSDDDEVPTCGQVAFGVCSMRRDPDAIHITGKKSALCVYSVLTDTISRYTPISDGKMRYVINGWLFASSNGRIDGNLKQQAKMRQIVFTREDLLYVVDLEDHEKKEKMFKLSTEQVQQVSQKAQAATKTRKTAPAIMRRSRK